MNNYTLRMKELRDAGVTEEGLTAARAEYKAAGLDLSKVFGRGWRLFGIHPSKPITFTHWGSLGHLVQCRESLIDQYRDAIAKAEGR